MEEDNKEAIYKVTALGERKESPYLRILKHNVNLTNKLPLKKAIGKLAKMNVDIIYIDVLGRIDESKTKRLSDYFD